MYCWSIRVVIVVSTQLLTNRTNNFRTMNILNLFFLSPLVSYFYCPRSRLKGLKYRLSRVYIHSFYLPIYFLVCYRSSRVYTHSLIYKSINLPTTITYLLLYTVQRLFTYLLIYLQPLRIYCHLLYITLSVTHLMPLILKCGPATQGK